MPLYHFHTFEHCNDWIRIGFLCLPIRLEGSVLDSWTQVISMVSGISRWLMKTFSLSCTSTLNNSNYVELSGVYGGNRMVYLFIDALEEKHYLRMRDLLQPQGNCIELWPRVATKAPDSTLNDFFLWWYLKSKMFKTQPRDCSRHRLET